MAQAAPTILSFVFAIISIIASILFKMILKIPGCNGYGLGVCCFLVNGVIIGGLILVFYLIIFFAIGNIYNTIYGVYGAQILNKRASITIWAFVTSTFMSTYSMLYCFVRKIKNEPHYTALMFGSGNILLFSVSFILFGAFGITDGYLFFSQPVLDSTTLLVMNFFLFGYALTVFSHILMIFLYLKQGFRWILFISLGCFFGPLVIALIIFFNLTSWNLLYIVISIYLVSCGVGIFFFAKNYEKDVETEVGESQLTPLN